MNRVVPKCKLKEICEHLQICFKLTSGNKDGNTRTETIGDKKNPTYHIGLVEEHYFIIEKTNVTSYCLLNYYDVKDIKNCNMIWTKYKDEYKKSNNKLSNFEKDLEKLQKLLDDIESDKLTLEQTLDKYKDMDYDTMVDEYNKPIEEEDNRRLEEFKKEIEKNNK